VLGSRGKMRQASSWSAGIRQSGHLPLVSSLDHRGGQDLPYLCQNDNGKEADLDVGGGEADCTRAGARRRPELHRLVAVSC
jgi:hypothetical protein